MGLNQTDLSKVPANFSEKDCYSRIYEWHKTYGKVKITSVYGRQDAYAKAYAALVDSIPAPTKATSADRDFVFGEVISMLMEWSYHQEDDYGIKIAAYAHHALDHKYPKGFFDQSFQTNKKTSQLYSEFSTDNWKKKYSDNQTNE